MSITLGGEIIENSATYKGRKTDRMLSKILQKLHGFNPYGEQENENDSGLMNEDNNGETPAAETTETNGNEQNSEDHKDSPADPAASFSEHAMDYSKTSHGNESRHGPRLGESRTRSEHTYANGGIHDYYELNQTGHQSDRADSQQQQRTTKVDVYNMTRGEPSLKQAIPRICMTVADVATSVDKPSTPPTYDEFTRQASRHSDAETDNNYTGKYNDTMLRQAKGDHSIQPNANSTELQQNNFPPDLTCFMCHRQYREPRFLPCLHSFCFPCLEEEVEHRTENRIRCPKCQRDYDLGHFHSVKGLPTNFVATTMIDKAALDRFETDPIACSSCEEKLPATVRCTDCMDYLCSTCHIAHHRLRLTKGHQILALHEIRRSKNVAELLHRPMYCPLHSHEKIRFYCKSCEQAICRECTMSSHSSREHRYFSVNEVIENERQFIQKILEKVRQRDPLVRQAVQTVQEVEKRLEAKAKVAKSEINKCYPRLIQALQERYKYMLNEVDKMYHGKSKVLNLQQRRLEFDLDNLSDTCKVTEDVLQYGNETEILVVRRLLSNRLEELHTTKVRHDPEENDVVYFSAQEETMMKAIQALGSVKVSSAYAALSCVVGALKRVPQGKRSSFTVNTRDHYGTQCNEGGERLQASVQTSIGDYVLTEVTDNKDGSYTISFRPTALGTHRVSVCIQNEHVQGSPFTVQVVQSGGMILKFGRKGVHVGEFNGIFGVAVDPIEARIVVTDCHNHRVQVFSSDGQFLYHFGRKGEGSGEFQCPTGVAVDVRGQIIVCERLSYRLQVFSRDGSFLREYRIPDLKASTLAVGEGDQIVIADSANRCVHVVNMETGHSIKFGSFGDESGELSYPCYVTVNPRGHIIVSDMHSHKIQVFDSRGQFLFNFGKKGSLDGELLRPTGVAVSREGHIIVADRDNHRVQIFSTDGKFLHKFGSKGDGDGQLNDPHGLAVTKDGSIVVADFRNNRVQVFGRVG